jgi:hypothetical protein
LAYESEAQESFLITDKDEYKQTVLSSLSKISDSIISELKRRSDVPVVNTSSKKGKLYDLPEADVYKTAIAEAGEE